jgi:hypothetical protein
MDLSFPQRQSTIILVHPFPGHQAGIASEAGIVGLKLGS